MEQQFEPHAIYQKYMPTYDHSMQIAQIPLTDKHQNFKGYALVSVIDAPRLLQYSYSIRGKRSKKYVKSSITLSMHELVVGQKAPPGHVIDHWNSNRFDNRRENLRFLTYGQNAQNKEKKAGCTSKYIGVHLDPNGKWRAFISNNGKMEYLGAYPDEEFAAKIYDIHRIATMGPGCKTNNLLQSHEIEWIVKNGIPPGYHKPDTKRDLPKNIRLTTSGSYQYSKMRKGINYRKNFKTLDDAVAHKDEIEKKWAEEDATAERIRITNIIRNAQGIAIIYAVCGGIKYEIWVDDVMWPELSNISWNLNGDGYVHTAKTGGQYLIHRLIWTRCVGEIPEGLTIDHRISSNKFDNRLSNLRLADRSLQGHNQVKRSTSLDKYKGVQFRWPNYIAVIGHTRYGKYARAEDAARRVNEEYAKLYNGQATLNNIDWSVVTTKDNRITLDMITREFIENLIDVKDFDNLLRVLKLDAVNGGPFQTSKLRGCHIPELKRYLIDRYFQRR